MHCCTTKQPSVQIFNLFNILKNATVERVIKAFRIKLALLSRHLKAKGIKYYRPKEGESQLNEW